MFGLELSFIWAGIIAGAVLIYVVLDGFDLGVGLLFPMTKDEGERNDVEIDFDAWSEYYDDEVWWSSAGAEEPTMKTEQEEVKAKREKREIRLAACGSI